jgi:hypothetical protein
MKVFVKKFQDGGAVAPETEGQEMPQEGAPQEEQGGQEDPLM